MKSIFARLALALACMALLGACKTTKKPVLNPQGKRDALSQAEVVATMQRYTELLRTGPLEALVSFYTFDAELLEPGVEPIRGRDAIRDFLRPMFTDFEIQSASTQTEIIDAYGPLVYQWGTFVQRIGERGKNGSEVRGRFVAAWRHEGDGQWRIARLLVQPAPAASQ